MYTDLTEGCLETGNQLEDICRLEWWTKVWTGVVAIEFDSILCNVCFLWLNVQWDIIHLFSLLPTGSPEGPFWLVYFLTIEFNCHPSSLLRAHVSLWCVGLFLKYETQPSLIGPVITIFFVVVFTDEETDRKINHNSRISHHWLINEEN